MFEETSLVKFQAAVSSSCCWTRSSYCIEAARVDLVDAACQKFRPNGLLSWTCSDPLVNRVDRCWGDHDVALSQMIDTRRRFGMQGRISLWLSFECTDHRRSTLEFLDRLQRTPSCIRNALYSLDVYHMEWRSSSVQWRWFEMTLMVTLSSKRTWEGIWWIMLFVY